jgi:hypothetical protein
VTSLRELFAETWRRGADRSPDATAILAALPVLLIALVLPGGLRAIVALPILLIAPGLALQLAAGRRPAEGDRWLAASLSLILSIALIPLLVLGEYAFHQHVDELVLVPLVVVATAALAGIALAFHPQPAGAPSLFGLATGGRRRPPAAVLAAAAVVAGTGILVIVAWAALPGAKAAPYSAIALRGSWATTRQVRYEQAKRPFAVALQVENRTRVTRRYRVVPTLAGETWKGALMTIEPGATWTGKIRGTIPAGGCAHRLQIALRCDPGTCSQSLIVWFKDRRQLPAACSTLAAGG